MSTIKRALVLLALLIQLVSNQANQVASGQQQQQRRSTDEQLKSVSGPFCAQNGDSKTTTISKKVFCFYDIQDDFRPQDLNPCLCTHVVYSYVAVRKNLSFIAGKKGDLRSLASLKRKNANLKLLVSLRPDDYFSFESSNTGNDTSPGDATFAQQSATATNEMHQKFAKRVRDFIVRHSLDGINLDWPYFAQTINGGRGSGQLISGSSREHLTLALQAINENFQTSLGQSSPSAAYLRLLQAPLVTLTVSKDFHSLVDGYDFRSLSKLVDYVHLPAFDFDLNVDQYSIGHPARLHGIFDAENLDTLVDLLLSSGLPSDQLIAGIPAHGVQITSKPASSLTSSTTGNNSTIDEQLEAAANISIVSHSEVCRVRDLARQNCTTGSGDQQQQACWTMSRSRDLTAPFAYDSEHWIGFDDETSVKLKAKYVLLRHLAGVAMFTVNHDDPSGGCGFGPFPLLSVVNSVLAKALTLQHPQMSSSPNHKSQVGSDMGVAGSSPRGYFTRAPGQMLTATSLVAQIFGNKPRQPQAQLPTTTSTSTSAPPASGLAATGGDLMQSATDEAPANHRADGSEVGVAASSTSTSGGLMSFVDIIEKYGVVNRLDGSEQPEAAGDQALPCDKVGYQRYPRDCSRFYRCVQTPPITSVAAPAVTSAGSENKTTKTAILSSITRLQYECPSGLVFDESYQICNWPSWSAQCTGSGEVNSITNSKFTCPNYGYFQNQENCEYFYYCSDYNRGTTQAYQFRCPFELGFDEDKLQCNWKWLVRGCNTSGGNTTQTGSASNSTSVEMAQKYLASLSSTTTTSTTAAPTTTAQPEVATNSSDQASTSGVQISRRSLELDDDTATGRGFTPALGSHMTSLLASISAIREHLRVRKANGAATGSGAKPSSSGDKLLESASEVKPARQKYPSFIGMPSSQSTDNQPTVAAAPPSPLASIGSFRLRRKPSSNQQRQESSTTKATPTSGGETAASASQSDSVYASTPYRRRPPPPSMFSFLPNSALYMVVDSLRSVGEAAGDEINRYMRLAGDRMRDLLGQRGPGAIMTTKTSHKSTSVAQRRTDGAGGLARLAAKLTLATPTRRFAVPNAGANFQHFEDENRRTKRTKRDTSGGESGEAEVAPEEDGDLQALESGGGHHAGATYAAPPPHMQQASHYRPAQHYRDPLNRPAGYPLNSLDPAAVQAVLGPEPKLYSQPSHLIIDQMSGISQQDYERLLRNNPMMMMQHKQPLPVAHSNHQQQDPMMSSGSEQVVSQYQPQVMMNNQQHNQKMIIEQILGQAREAFTISHQQQPEVAIPFGMPAIHRPAGSDQEVKLMANLQQQQQKQPTQQKRRSTVAMRLAATLSLPKFSLLPTTSTTSLPPTITSTSAAPVTTTGSGVEKLKTSSSYISSFLPSFSDVVVAPARNIMNKAMGFNRAVQGLISTLAPGGGSKPVASPKPGSLLSSEQQQRLNQQLATTPMSLPLRNFQPEAQRFQQHQQQQQFPVQQVQVNRTTQQGPLLLTEQEARALSAQLDQLSKEQLEALSNDLFKNDQRVKQQQQQPPTQHTTESPDYVVRLLKMLSQTSHNPEDIRLLDQLAHQLNNPRPNGQDQSLIEIGQPDDLALLEALGIIPPQQQASPPPPPPNQSSNDTAAHAAQADNRPEASYTNYQHTPNEMQPAASMNPYQRPGGMKPLMMKTMTGSGGGGGNQKHQLRLIEGMPPLEIDEESLGTTKFIPVALQVQNEVTSPAPKYNKYEQQTSYGQSYMTTTTTTTTSRPTQLMSKLINQQVIEKQVPPVKQTFKEIIENSVTTPDGIETTIETRTKSAISGGAAFSIASQVGLGMIPPSFGGSLPADSPRLSGHSECPKCSASVNGTGHAGTGSDSTTGSGTNSTTSSTTNSTSTGSGSSSSKSLTSKVQVSAAGVKGGAADSYGGATGSDGSFSSSDHATFHQGGVDFNSLSAEQREALMNSQQFNSFGQQATNPQQVDFGSFQAGSEISSTSGNGARPTSIAELMQRQQQQQQLEGGGFDQPTGMQGGRAATSSVTNQVLLQGAQQPLTQRQSASAFANARAPGGSTVTLNSYNFATQPVDQFEEVVITKKFKPFPKTTMVPQMSTYTMEEVSGAATSPAPEVAITQQNIDSSELGGGGGLTGSGNFDEQQQQKIAVDGNQSGGANPSGSSAQSSSSALAGSDAGSSSSSSSSSTGNSQQGQQHMDMNDEEFSTVASSFGETAPNAGSGAANQPEVANSMTRTELQMQQQIAQDLKSIGDQLRQQELAEGGGDQSNSNNNNNNSDGIERESESTRISGAPTTTTTTASKVGSSKRRKSQGRKSATSTTTTTTTTTTTPTPTSEEPATAKRSVPTEPTGSSSTTTSTRAPRPGASRVEEAFGNFMFELKRSRRVEEPKASTTTSTSTTSTTTSTTTTTTTSTTAKPSSESIDSAGTEVRNQRRKSRSKKARNQANRSRGDLSRASSNRKSQSSSSGKLDHHSKKSSNSKPEVMDYFRPGALKRHPKFVNYIKSALVFCIYGACMERECAPAFKRRKWLDAIDRLTTICSPFVLITTLYKFMRRRGGVVQADVELAQSNTWQWRELVTLDYLPRINQFATLYYGLLLMTVGVPLTWRLYMRFVRQQPPASQLSRAGLSSIVQSIDDHFSGGGEGGTTANQKSLESYAEKFFASPGRHFDAKRELLDFFLSGPPEWTSSSRQLSDTENAYLAELIIAKTLEQFGGTNHLFATTTNRKRKLLARVHENWGETRGSRLFPHRQLRRRRLAKHQSECSDDEYDEQDDDDLVVRTRARRRCVASLSNNTYLVPIRSTDFLVDKTERRWLHLAAHFKAFCLLVFLLWAPLFSLTVLSLNQVNAQFGPLPATNSTTSGRANLDFFLSVYGRVEPIYACGQVTVPFVFTNILLVTFHADLIYKVEPIRHQLSQLAEQYIRSGRQTVNIQVVHAYQLKMWGFFDQVHLLDSFIAHYSILAIFMFVIGISFGSSFARVEDPLLKVGLAASLLADFISFTILHLIGEDITRKTLPMANAILSILARESNPYVKLEWQRILREYYRHGYVRTFTINGCYPVNMFTYLKTITATLAACTLTNRMFYRNMWHSSFASSSSSAAAHLSST